MHTERYSWWSLFKHGLRHNRDWQPAYRRATLADSYDVIIIGGGGHGGTQLGGQVLQVNQPVKRFVRRGLRGGGQGNQECGQGEAVEGRPAKAIWHGIPFWIEAT